MMFMHVRDAFPGARVVASSLDAYAHALVQAAPRLDLPLVTGTCDECVLATTRVCERGRGGRKMERGAAGDTLRQLHQLRT